MRLIVNADDCGYAPEITRGIIECARRGIVTSTGIFGNTANLRETVEAVAEVPSLEVGVHFSLSQGSPLTTAMSRALARHGGRFPSKFAMAWLISRGAIGEKVLWDELWAQADACASSGLRIAFLNAHEHLHMHPRVYPLVDEIARRLDVRHVRITEPDVVRAGDPGGALRGLIIRMLMPERRSGEPRVRFVGLARSGRVDVAYLTNLFERLEPGGVYELMCHPGYDSPELAADPRLRAYHDWELERRTLQDSRVIEMIQRRGIALTRFSDLAATPAAT